MPTIQAVSSVLVLTCQHPLPSMMLCKFNPAPASYRVTRVTSIAISSCATPRWISMRSFRSMPSSPAPDATGRLQRKIGTTAASPVANSCSTPFLRFNLPASGLISAGSASSCAALPLPGDISHHRDNHQLPFQESFPCRPNPRGTDTGTAAAYRIRVRFSSNSFVTVNERVIKPSSHPQCLRAKKDLSLSRSRFCP